MFFSRSVWRSEDGAPIERFSAAKVDLIHLLVSHIYNEQKGSELKHSENPVFKLQFVENRRFV